MVMAIYNDFVTARALCLVTLKYPYLMLFLSWLCQQIEWILDCLMLGWYGKSVAYF